MPVADDQSAAAFSVRERVALAALGLATIAVLPGALNRFVFVKVAVAAAGCALAAWPSRRGRLPRAVVAVVGAGAVVLLVAAVTSASVSGAVFGRAPRYEGLFVLPVYVASAGAGAWLLGPARRRAAMPWWLHLLALSAAAIALEAVLETAGLRPLASDVARPGSLLGNASDEGAIGVLLAAPLAGAAVTARDRWCVVGAVAAAAVVVLSASRGALVGIAVAAVVLAAALHRRRPHTVESRSSRPFLVALGAGIVAILVATLALPFTRSRVLGLSPLARATATGRLLLWRETLVLLEHHWWLGVGPSGFVDAIGVEHTRQWQQRYGAANPPDSPHNWLLQAASAGGLLLVVLAIALVALVAYRGWRAVGEQQTLGERGAFAGLLAGVAGYGAALAFHLTSPGTTPLAAFCAGALVAVAPRGATEATRGEKGAWMHSSAFAAGTALTMGALALVLTSAALAELPLRAAIENLGAGRLDDAQHEFHLAHLLRPWDGEIATTAGHAFVVAAQADAARPRGLAASRHAAALARPWVDEELSSFPNSIEALEDAAALDQLADRPGGAATLLARASRLDPLNPQVLLGQGIVAADEHRDTLAVRLLETSAEIDRSSPLPWQALATVYRSEGQLTLAGRAESRALHLAR